MGFVFWAQLIREFGHKRSAVGRMRSFAAKSGMGEPETRSPIGPVGLLSSVRRDPPPKGHPARQSERGATVREAATG